MTDSKNPETIALHGGWRRDESTTAVAVPIYQTTSYQFDSPDHAAKLFGLEELGNFGDSRSLAIHPATTTHSQLSKEEQLKTGVTEGYVRLAVGIEHIDDILEDLKNALDIV